MPKLLPPPPLEPETIQELLQKATDSKLKNLARERLWLDAQVPRYLAFLRTENECRNRDASLLLLDRSRVRIDDYWHSQNSAAWPDYYHASWLDGWDQPDQFILAQAPFDGVTELDFWRMMLHTECKAIIVLASNVGSNNEKQKKINKENHVSAFWPTEKQKWAPKHDKNGPHKHLEYAYNKMIVELKEKRTSQNDHMYDLVVKDRLVAENVIMPKEKTSGTPVRLVHVTDWNSDVELPTRLSILAQNLGTTAKMSKPVAIVCPTGVHRAGVLLATHIAFRRALVQKTMDIDAIIHSIRYQRYGVLQHVEHYLGLIDAVITFSIEKNLVEIDKLPHVGSKGARKKESRTPSPDEQPQKRADSVSSKTHSKRAIADARTAKPTEDKDDNKTVGGDVTSAWQ